MVSKAEIVNAKRNLPPAWANKLLGQTATDSGYSSWDDTEKSIARASSSGGIFARLKDDGDKVVVVFCGLPMPRYVVWNGTGFDKYDADVHDKRPAPRHMINVFVPEENTMKVLECNVGMMSNLKKVRDKYGLEKYTFEIERHGKAGDPKTTYSILPDTEIDEELGEVLASVELHDLSEYV